VITKTVFDLSEVLVQGLVGIEKQLSQILPVSEDEILSCFGGKLLDEICIGNISEDTYLRTILTEQGWNIDITELKAIIRNNFQEIVGTVPLLVHLSARYDIVLLSDHAREWVSHIKSVHSFWGAFEYTFFSYELKKTKKDPDIFIEVLKRMNCSAQECLFIDDSHQNITVAASVGIKGIQFRNAQQLQKELVDMRVWDHVAI
jgi:HAD superfamily hydrolase (TIGR01509 family)